MSEIRVISSEIDGADLRRQKRLSPRHLRCDGTADDAEINDAIRTAGKQTWVLPEGAWQRIFGRKR